MEVAVQTRLNYLQRFKDTAAYRIKNLQKQLEQSVHQTELDKINRQYEDVAEKYRDILEQQKTFVQQSEKSSIVQVKSSNKSKTNKEKEFFLQEENQKLIDEVAFLKRQLEIDKEKLHVLEETFENLKNQGLINAGKNSSFPFNQRKKNSNFLFRLRSTNEQHRFFTSVIDRRECSESFTSNYRFRNERIERTTTC